MINQGGKTIRAVELEKTIYRQTAGPASSKYDAQTAALKCTKRRVDLSSVVRYRVSLHFFPTQSAFCCSILSILRDDPSISATSMQQSERISWERSFNQVVDLTRLFPSTLQEPEVVKVVSKSKSILDGRNWKDPRMPAKGEKTVSTFSPPGRPPSAVLGHGDILHEPTITGDVLDKLRYESGAESPEGPPGESRGSGVVSMDMIVSGRPITPSSPSVSRGVSAGNRSKCGSVASDDKYKYQIEVRTCLEFKLDPMIVKTRIQYQTLTICSFP